MFSEFASQTWTTSATGATQTANTDIGVNGTSRKMVFTEANAWVQLNFTAVTGSEWEEIVFHLQMLPTLERTDQFKITIDGTDFTYTRLEQGLWPQLIDCSLMGSITSIRITCLTTNLTLFLSYPGVRKVTYEKMDVDVITAMKEAIFISYGVTKSLTQNITAGARVVPLNNTSYVNNTSRLLLTDGVKSEYVDLLKLDGTTKDAIVNSYAKTTTVVTVVCPVISEDYDDLEPNPVVGIVITGHGSFKEDEIQLMKGESYAGAKLKRYLGAIQLLVYLESSSMDKLIYMARQFDDNYGDRFQILLDGVPQECYLEDVVFNETTDLGNLPRKAYFYSIDPSPITVMRKKEIDDLTITIGSETP